MSKTIKIIDLLNKIANKEEVPEKIKFEDVIYEYDKERKDYIKVIDDWCSETLLYHVMYCHFIKEILENEVELIDNDEIDIESIGELPEVDDTSAYDVISIGANRVKINKLIQSVKQLNREIKELKEKE